MDKETLEEAAANLADPNICKTDNWIAGARWMEQSLIEAAEHNYPGGDVWTEEQALIRRLAFKNGAKWMEEQIEKLKDFEVWKEWKNTGVIKSE